MSERNRERERKAERERERKAENERGRETLPFRKFNYYHNCLFFFLSAVP